MSISNKKKTAKPAVFDMTFDRLIMIIGAAVFCPFLPAASPSSHFPGNINNIRYIK